MTTTQTPPRVKSRRAARPNVNDYRAAPPTEIVSFPNRWLWTAEQLQEAYDKGVFGPEARLELIEGEVIRKMTQKEPHTTALHLAQKTLEVVFSTGYYVRGQAPLLFGPNNKPEPDLAVVPGGIRDYLGKHPTTAVLVVEVSDSTLQFDRTTKAAVYARAQIADYWILNLVDGVVEVHRQPAPMPGQPLGHHFKSITRLVPGDTLAPLAAPDAQIAVADLLP